MRVVHNGQRWRKSTGKPVVVGPESVRVHVTRGKNKEVRGVSVTLDVADQFRFRLRPEWWLDRFAKRFGIAQEWQTGDERFDEKVFILSEDPTLLETLSSDRELRELVATILDFHGGARLECARGQLMFDATLSEVDRKLSDEHLREMYAREIQPALARLRDRLERISVGDWRADRDPALRRKGWLVGVSTAIAATGIVGLFVGFMYDRHQVALDVIPRYSAWVTGGTGAALLAAAVLWLGRSPHTHAVVLDVLFAAMPGAWLASTAGFTWYNETHDESAPSHVVAHVESMYTTKHRSSTNYHLVVSGWPDAPGNRDVVVRKDEYSLTSVGGCVVLLWHRGRLGDGWISGYERADTCGPVLKDGGVE